MGKSTRKQIVFDIDTKVAREILGESKYREIYKNIEKCMKENGFEHIQGSGYTSKIPISKIEVVNVISELLDDYPYLSKCVRDIRQTSVFSERSLNALFKYDGTPGEFVQKKVDTKKQAAKEKRQRKGRSR